MSHNYSYRTSSDSFRAQVSRPDSYKRESDVYRPPVKSPDQDSASSAPSSSTAKELSNIITGNALSFLHSCGLDTSDLAQLAELPEHLISIESLPKLLLEIQERKLSGVPSSSRSGRTQPCRDSSTSHVWESGTRPEVVEYPLNLPLLPEVVEYPLNLPLRPKVVEYPLNLPLRPGVVESPLNLTSRTEVVEYPLNLPSRPLYPLPPEQTQNWQDRWGNSLQSAHISTSSGVLDNSKVEAPYCNKHTYSLSAPSSSSSTASRSYTDHNRMTRSSRERSSPKAQVDQLFKVPTRKEASDFCGKVPPVFPYACILCDITVLCEKDWSFHISGPQHANSQFHLVQKYPDWDQQIETARRNESKTLPVHRAAQKTGGATRDYTPDREKRHGVKTKEVKDKVPTRKEAAEFHGKVPPVFPYACVLCDVTVLTGTDWVTHVSSPQHTNRQYRLIENDYYPEWDQRIESARRNETSQSRSSDTRGEKQEDKKEHALDSKKRKKSPEKNKGKVVCVKFAPNTVEEGYLKRLLGQFGAVEKIVMFHALALVEMGTLDQSADVVKYFTANPLELKGSQIKFSLGLPLSSNIVTFTPLPAGGATSSELKAIAKRFGSVKNTMFLPNRGYVEMAETADAEKLVEHYLEKALKLKGKTVQVSFSTEYDVFKKLDCEKRPSRSDSKRSSRGGSSSHRNSPSPKRRRSSEKSHSSRSHGSKEREDTQHSRSKSSTSSRRSPHSSPSSLKPKTMASDEDAKENTTVSTEIDATVDSDSDLEGVEVIADDEELLHYDDELTREVQDSNEEGKTGEENAELCDQTSSSSTAVAKEITSADKVEEKPSDRHREENLPSDTVSAPSVISDTQVKSSEDASNSTIPETSHCQTKEQTTKEHSHQRLESDLNFDFPENIENCITLDEIIDDDFSENQDDQPKSSSVKMEDTPGEVTKTTDHPVPSSSVTSEQSHEQLNCAVEESASGTGAEPDNPEEEPEAIINSGEQSTEKEDPENEPESTKVEQEVFGKVLSVSNLPRAENYTDQDFVNLAKRYGEVKHYLLSLSSKKGFIEMVHSSDVDRIVADSKNKDLVLRGSFLKVEVSTKYSSLSSEGVTLESDSDDEESSKTDHIEENISNDCATSNGNTEPLFASDAMSGPTTETSSKPDIRNKPLGTEFVRPVVGYACNLCDVIYASEEEAKDEHCRSQSHHEKVKEHMEKKKIGF